MTGVQMCIASAFVGGLILGLIAGIFLAVVFYYSCADNSEIGKRDHALRLLRVHYAWCKSELNYGRSHNEDDRNMKAHYMRKGLDWERIARYWKRKAEVLK